jgi:dihydrofolate reductase
MKRKCVLFMHLSLDGYATDLKDALDWIPYDDELEKYAEEVIAEVGTPVYGRKTYELMKSFWPDLLKDPSASKHDRDHRAKRGSHENRSNA